MLIKRKDIGYSIYSRLEEAIRSWLRDRLLKLHGGDWHSHIPDGVESKAKNHIAVSHHEIAEDPLALLEETDIPDLMEIVCFRKNFRNYVTDETISQQAFRENFITLYELRNKIAHVKRTFSAVDLDRLIEISTKYQPMLEAHSSDLAETLQWINSNPEKVLINIPESFLIDEDQLAFAQPTNLPPADYTPDGGFIGRKDDIEKVEKLLLGELHRVITISGAGGVGKTALAHQVCTNLLKKETVPFDAIVWVSAKEEELTLTGIEPIEPTVRNYEGVLNSILETFGWLDDLGNSLEKKSESVEVILRAGSGGILLVVDNLETIRDERVIEYIKDFPPPNKVLITSRMGLGEVERRHALKELTSKDAVLLLRTIAREKGVTSLAMQSDDVLASYVDKMSRYPLAIKWVVGQVALGKDINLAIGNLTSSTGDVAKFCFDHIFNNLLNEDAKMVLYVLAAYDKPLVQGVLSHVSNLPPQQLDMALRDLTIASLVIPAQLRTPDSTIETKYELLPLTRNYMYAKLRAQPSVRESIERRIQGVQNLLEEADRAGKQYRYSLRDMGAGSDEEKIAATWALTAHQRQQAGDYEGALALFQRATEIAPQFSAVYRNWATMESDAGFHDKADELMKKASNLSPNNAFIWFVWSNIEKKRQRYDRAFEYLSRALAISPKDTVFMGALGEVEKRRGNFENANELLLKAIEGSPTDGNRRRHEIICHTSLAENSRRWADSLIYDKRTEEAMLRLQDAYEHASKAAELGKDDVRAQDTYRHVCLELGLLMTRQESFEKAMPYLEKAIKPSSKRVKDRKITEVGCYFITNKLIEEGQIERAKIYYSLGKKALIDGSRYIDLFKTLGLEFSETRIKGKLVKIVYGKGYGFILTETVPPQTIFLHITQIEPEVSIEEFEGLLNSMLSFVMEVSVKKDNRSAAKRVRLLRQDDV